MANTTAKQKLSQPKCKYCGRFLPIYYVRVRSGRKYREVYHKRRRFCDQKCQGLSLRGSGESYIMIWIDGKRVYLHIHVMETQLGRKLLPGEIVHHKNEDIHDNAPSNLEVATDRADHLRKHNFYRKSERPMTAKERKKMEADIDEFGF